MARRYPRGLWKPLGEQTEERMTAHDIVCVHTMVGSLLGTESMFGLEGYGGTEAHFGTGGDGEQVRQWQDLAFTADANLEGNYRVISIENADKGPGFPAWAGENVPGFTDRQIDDLVDLIGWLCSTEAHADCPSSWTCHQQGIPRRLVPDSKPGRRGIAYHRQGIDGNFPTGDGRVPGGEKWSESFGKICPGYRRSAQLVDIIIPRVAGQEDDMALTDQVNEQHTVKQVLSRLDRYIDNSADREKRMLAAIAGIAPEIGNLVEAELRVAIPGVDTAHLRRLVEAAATKAIKNTLGALNDPTA